MTRHGDEVRFTLGGDGFGGSFMAEHMLGGELRVRKDGKVDRWSNGFLGLGAKWKPLIDPMTKKQVEMPFVAGLRSWPPRASELIDFFPATGKPQPAPAEALAGAAPLLDQVPISALDLRFEARSKGSTPIRLSNGEGVITLTDHELALASNGRFKGRTYHTDPTRENTFRASGTVTGEITRPDLRAKLDRVRFVSEGTHAETIPFEDPSKLTLDASVKTRVEARLRDLRAELPTGTYLVVGGESKADFTGEGSLTLRPLDARDPSELKIDRNKNHWELTANGPVELGGLDALSAPAGTTLPSRLGLRGENGQPVVRASGTLGTRSGFLFTKTKIDVVGTTTTPGAIGVLEGTGATRREVKSTLKEGAKVDLHLYAFAGIKQSSLDALLAGVLTPVRATPAATGTPELGALNATVDARLSGTAVDTTITSPELTAKAPAADLDARVAARIRVGTARGAEIEVRAAAAEADLALTAPAEVTAGLPGGPVLRGTAAPGTRLGISTGELKRDPSTGVLSGPGARLEAHLVLTAGSVAMKELALALQGKVEVDLSAAIGFKIDPRALMNGGQPTSGPIDMDLALGIELAPGTVLKATAGANRGQVKLKGATKVSLKAAAKVDPATGKPVMGSLVGLDLAITADALDLSAILAPLGTVSASTTGRSTVTIKQASLELLPDGGLRIRHAGIAVELAPGEIVIRPNAAPAR